MAPWKRLRLTAPGIPELLLAGREREFLSRYAFPAMTATPGAFTDADLDEFARVYSRPDGWRGASGLYRSMLREPSGFWCRPGAYDGSDDGESDLSRRRW
ncbi:hypothetical protein ABZW11_03355 [Nonomuraea sp. NPDC004580]|uniref:hypothetical protein n=1 Tax=Nonomuraea sp. NPDC004580 TaxID=3154552 RepID=UPI0033B2086B